MEASGTGITCRRCGKHWELTEAGALAADRGETEFESIPAWYAWEREEIRKSLLDGSYRLDVPVKIGMMVDYKAIYMVGEGRLAHDKEGFHLTGCGGGWITASLPSAPTVSTPITSGMNWRT